MGVLVGLDLPSAGGELKQGSDPHTGATVRVGGETLKAEKGTVDLWHPKWKENQTALAAVIHTLDGTVVGSWSFGIVEQSQGQGCC